MPAKYDQFKLKDIIENNKNGKLVLPNFQRDFVWDLDKQKKLLSSFLCGLPIGSLLLLNGKKDDFSCKNLCYTGEPSKLADDCGFLLDGQQRLSSLSSFFSNLFGEIEDYDLNHDSLYSLLRNRWYIRLKPQEKEIDVFGWKTLKYAENSIYKYEPNDLIDFIGSFKVFKNKKDLWWHPAYSPTDENGNQLTIARKKEKIADEAAIAGFLPLWEFYEKPDTGLHEMVLRKIGERQRHIIESNIQDGKGTYFEVLGHLDQDIEEKVNSKESKEFIEEIWMELRTNWKKEIITCIKNSISLQEIPTILLPSDEVGRAVATFSAVNEGGTRLDPYDLIVARAAKSRQETSLTTRIVEILKQDLTELSDIYSGNTGDVPTSWSCEYFGVIADNVPTAIFKDIFLNSLSLYNHCKLKNNEPKVEHIKIKGILDLSHDEINNSVEPCIKAIQKALAFLCFRCGMKSVTDLSYKLMIQPITYCFFNDAIFNSPKLINKMEYWYWLSLFSGRYREYQNEVCVEDIEKLNLFISQEKNPFIEDEARIFNYEGYSNLDILLMNIAGDIPAAIHNGIMCYILSRQPRDLLIAYRLSSWEMNRQEEREVDGAKFKLELHDHHVMPLATEMTIHESTSKARNDKKCILNSPLNRTYILGKTNQTLGARTIAEYYPLIQESASYHHCIPAEDFSKKNNGEDDETFYKKFLKARFDNLNAKLKEELDQLR